MTVIGQMARRELTPELRAFLEERRYAVVATINADGSPHLSVLWYMLDGDDIVFNTPTMTTKHANLTRDPRVAVMFEDELRYVRVTGRARADLDQVKVTDDIRRIGLRYESAEAIAERMPIFMKRARVSYRVAVRRIFTKGI